MPQQNPENLIWIDLEMTGLDPMEDRIIEIATLVTDKNLNVLEEGPSLLSIRVMKCSKVWMSGVRRNMANQA